MAHRRFGLGFRKEFLRDGLVPPRNTPSELAQMNADKAHAGKIA
jgi:hypothetical protein